MKSVHVRIEGLVQGVGFRAFVAATAEGLQLNGWVRNRRDGSVEAVFQGEQHRIDRMLQACARGPRSARVFKVETLEAEGSDFSDFRIRETA